MIKTIMAMFTLFTFSFAANAGWISKKYCGPKEKVEAILRDLGAPVAFGGKISLGVKETENASKPKEVLSEDEAKQDRMVQILPELKSWYETSGGHYPIFVSSTCQIEHKRDPDGSLCFIVATAGATFRLENGHYAANDIVDNRIKNHLSPCANKAGLLIGASSNFETIPESAFKKLLKKKRDTNEENPTAR